MHWLTVTQGSVDLILGIEPPRSTDAVVSYRIWTADGAPAAQCGNGARCIAAWAVREGLTSKAQFSIDSPSGTHTVVSLGSQRFSIEMGIPQFDPEKIPLTDIHQESDQYEVDLGEQRVIRFVAVSMGNSHAVIDVDDVEKAPVTEIGPAFQSSSLLPSTVCVGFAAIKARDAVCLRVYEYEAGETLACGSGACAAVATLMRQGRIDRNVTVSLPGGELHITWPSDTEQIIMSGPAVFVFEGEFHHAAL